ncbi:hypothetical protein P7K49_007407 [Saguinus oedipus]|uniref:Uncharacterized protein n=1 Tax=Saguinus oedipus TaxID=9490 RepID=A0ABQ9VUS2_SAGOE|nr:hypothetical protein P7K49_007407 [Saguinus oedipus]
MPTVSNPSTGASAATKFAGLAKGATAGTVGTAAPKAAGPGQVHATRAGAATQKRQLRDGVGWAGGRFSEKGELQHHHHGSREDQQVYLGTAEGGEAEKLEPWLKSCSVKAKATGAKEVEAREGPAQKEGGEEGGAPRKESTVTLKPPSSCSLTSCSWERDAKKPEAAQRYRLGFSLHKTTSS